MLTGQVVYEQDSIIESGTTPEYQPNIEENFKLALVAFRTVGKQS